MIASRQRELMMTLFCLVVLAASSCGSGLARTTANLTACHQVGDVLNNVRGHTLASFESEWPSDAPTSTQLDQDVTNWLTLMDSGGWAPGGGEQTRTAQAAYAIEQDCRTTGAPFGGFVGGSG